MTAPTCGARTWLDRHTLLTCSRAPHAEGDHECVTETEGPVTWNAAPRVVVDCLRYDLPPNETRALIASLQRQLDALDPDAAIAAAERRMVEAFARAEALRSASIRLISHGNNGTTAEAALREASRALDASLDAADAWAALVEARDAKGGGA